MDIVAWLRGLELERYAPVFRHNDIDGNLLRRLTAEDLRELGVASVGHRRRLLNAIAAFGIPTPAADVSGLAAEATAALALKSDTERQSWLEAVAAWIGGQRAKGRPGIITCSTLKRSYRDMIIRDRPAVRLVYLRGSPTVIVGRLARAKSTSCPPTCCRARSIPSRNRGRTKIP